MVIVTRKNQGRSQFKAERDAHHRDAWNDSEKDVYSGIMGTCMKAIDSLTSPKRKFAARRNKRRVRPNSSIDCRRLLTMLLSRQLRSISALLVLLNIIYAQEATDSCEAAARRLGQPVDGWKIVKTFERAPSGKKRVKSETCVREVTDLECESLETLYYHPVKRTRIIRQNILTNLLPTRKRDRHTVAKKTAP